MLVRFTSSTSGQLVMLANHAHELFAWMDKEGSARGVFTLEQLTAAIAALRAGIEREKQETAQRAGAAAGGRGEAADGDAQEPDEDAEEDASATQRSAPKVSLGQRAQPLIRLMEQTHKEKGFILWEATADF